MTYQSISVRPISGALGAVVDGVDLSEDLDNSTASDVHKALLDHCVIFFRDQHLTPEQQLRLGRRFGMLLARLEGECALSSLARKVRSIAITGPARRRYNNTLRGLSSLPVRVDPM